MYQVALSLFQVRLMQMKEGFLGQQALLGGDGQLVLDGLGVLAGGAGGEQVGLDLGLGAGGAHDQLAACFQPVLQHIGLGQVDLSLPVAEGYGFSGCWARRPFMIRAILSAPAAPSKVTLTTPLR